MPKIIERPEQLGLSIFDLDSVYPELKVKLLKGNLDLSQKPAKVGKDAVVPFLQGVPLELQATVIDTIRSQNRKNLDSPVKAYLRRTPTSSWQKLGDSVVLTVARNGVIILNPKFFPTGRKPLKAPEPVKVNVGKSLLRK